MIVVATTPGREDWLKQCLTSINRSVMVLSDYSYELGKINWLINNTKIERFMFLQDSVVIKDERLFELLYNDKGSIAITNDPTMYGMYLGIYERKYLERIDIPIPKSKAQAIEYELTWTEQYCRMAKNVRLAFTDLNDRSAKRKEVIFGRENLVLENDFLIKYKGNWGQKPALD
jgi:hypothetical protein